EAAGGQRNAQHQVLVIRAGRKIDGGSAARAAATFQGDKAAAVDGHGHAEAVEVIEAGRASVIAQAQVAVAVRVDAGGTDEGLGTAPQAHAITAGVNATTSGKGAKATVEGFFIHGRLREGIRHGQYGQGRNEDQLKFADSLPQAKSKLAEVSHRSNPLYWLW